MSQLPEVGSTWIHRESLTVVQVLNVVSREVVSVGHGPTKLFANIGIEGELYRDFIPDGTVTLDILGGLLWGIGPKSATWDISPNLWLRWRISGELMIQSDDWEKPIPCGSIRDILLAMQVFGASPTGAKEGNDPC